MNNSESENISFSVSILEEKYLRLIDEILSNFVDKMRYIDFLDENCFSNREGYRIFIKIIEALKKYGLVSEKRYSNIKNEYRVLSYEYGGLDKLKKLVEEFPDIRERIEDISIWFVGYDVMSILNNISFKKHPFNQIYYLVTPEKLEKKINPSKVEAFLSNSSDIRQFEKFLRHIFSILGIKLQSDLEKRGLITVGEAKFVYNKLYNASIYVPYDVREFFEVMIQKADTIVERYQELAKHKNGIYVDENVFCITEQMIKDCVNEINRSRQSKIRVKDMADYFDCMIVEKRAVKIRENRLDESVSYFDIIYVFKRGKIEKLGLDLFGIDYVETIVEEVKKKYPFVTKEETQIEILKDEVVGG